MYSIVKATDLAEKIRLFVVKAPLVAAKARPGHFVIVRRDETSERIPLTIADYDAGEGTLTLVVQALGKSTADINAMQPGQAFQDLLGPLGHASQIEMFGTVVCIGGGLGVAPVYPVAKAMKEAGNRVISIIGARSRDLVFFAEEMAGVSDELRLATDDGSLGRQGFVSHALQDIYDEGIKPDRIIAIGPLLMMHAVADIGKARCTATVVSLNALMVDGTGMCGGCRVTVGGRTAFACVDGPEFDGHEVDFHELMRRQSRFSEEEKSALHGSQTGGHKCRIR